MNNTTGHAHDATAWLQLARRLQKQQLQQLSQLGELASQLSALVHMLQCERGASNIYLCSGGLLYTAECRAGGALVDERLALFYASLERARAVAGSALCWRIARALDELAQLPALRAQIGRRQIAAEAATEQFSRVIRHLLNIAPQLNDSIDDPPVAGRMVALYSFMQGKELVDRIDGQQPCFDSFQALGSPATVQLFRTQCHAGLDIEQLRRIACTRQPAADGGETALRWFGLQTQRLEQLREVEEQLIDDLLDATDALLADDAPGWQAGEEDDSVTPRLDKQLLPLVRQQAYELQQLSSQLASLKDALEERKLIEKAKSLLMTHQGMQEEQAWQTLRKMAMDKNQRMVEIARALLMVKAIWPLTPKE
ncbi:nitrate- and nitrite sensing domain-containing protein [Klebsiella pneumoniae]|nr:nitrate- and nitrite sensing domain-containing protein [Klebsiella pneumoniae]